MLQLLLTNSKPRATSHHSCKGAMQSIHIKSAASTNIKRNLCERLISSHIISCCAKYLIKAKYYFLQLWIIYYVTLKLRGWKIACGDFLFLKPICLFIMELMSVSDI